MSAAARRPAIPAAAVAASPSPLNDGKQIKSHWSDQSIMEKRSRSMRAISNTSIRSASSQRLTTVNQTAVTKPLADSTPIINISYPNSGFAINPDATASTTTTTTTNGPGVDPAALAEELDYITVSGSSPNNNNGLASPRGDKASRILGIKHRRSMEPIPASARTSIVSTRSARDPPPSPSFTPTSPLTSLYVVSGLPKSPHTWTLADPDSVLGLHHSDGAVSRWWRPEVLGSTVSPGAGGGKKKKRGKNDEVHKGAGALSKQEVGKMLSKALKLSFTREVEIVASTLQPASTIHTFTFTLPAPNTPLAPTPSGDLLRASVLTAGDRSSAATFSYPYSDDPFARPSSAYLGPPSVLGHPAQHNSTSAAAAAAAAASANDLNPAIGSGGTVTYHGVCLTVWSHADAERSNAIRRTLEAGRSRKESAQSLVAARLKSLRAETAIPGVGSDGPDPSIQVRKSNRKNARSPWADADTDGETEGEGAVSESDFEVASTVGHGPGESTLFLPGDTVFWLPYALTLVSRHPVYDLMRDYLTLSWARFSKDVQSHTLQISKILAHPAPRAGDVIKLDASAKNDGGETSLEVIARFPGGLDFGRGLVDINFTMWPLFKCLNIDNILTICEIALAPTGRILFFSRHPAMLGIAVLTIKYLVELRGWNGIALSAVHSRDAKIYIDDPGPWIMGLATEARYAVRPAPEVCVCDLDINYLSCPSPPPGVVSVKQQRERYRQRLLSAFDSHYHPDHSVPSEFKEAFPAGRFRPVCKIQAKRGASSSAVADTVKSPDWWHSTRIIQAFDSVLADKFKKPSFLKRIAIFSAVKRPPQLTAAEQLIQHSIRKRATAFVDARDDLETKIGRLSRRLNFLMTESDLWRDKFVTFEQYAEKLSAEAGQLRTKINKEQRETKRLSGLVSMTAAEKAKLQNQLRDTESAHREAMLELERMKQTMEKMEEEREEMVAEVEAQIERALASMAVDIDDESLYTDSRPGSRLSERAPSGLSGEGTRLRSFGTDSTLAEILDDAKDETVVQLIERTTGTIEEDVEEDDDAADSNQKKKRFSNSELDIRQDGMSAVDEGISHKSDKIAQKVSEIQQKLEQALASDRRSAKWRSSQDSEGETTTSEGYRRRRKGPRLTGPQPSRRRNRSRAGTSSSTQTQPHDSSNQTDDGTVTGSPRPSSRTLMVSPDTGSKTPTEGVRSSLETSRGNVQTPEPKTLVLRTEQSDSTLLSAARRSQSPDELSPATPALTQGGTGEDSDTDFQSAYSTSPRVSYFDGSENTGDVKSDNFPNDKEDGTVTKSQRDRLLSTGTAVNIHALAPAMT